MATNVLTEDQLKHGRSKRHELQRRQWQARRELLQYELSKGKSKAQVAREWGISRQMVWKILNRT